MTIPWLEGDDPFPPVERALVEPNGLLAAGADLSPARLIDAYSRGIFPWFNEDDPILWWTPDPRMVLFVDELRVSRSLRRVLASGRFRVTADTAFEAVMAGCAAPRGDQQGTWITGEMTAAYSALAARGAAHSIEVWQDGALAGGLYGVAIGRMFFGESMFSRVSDASKVALVHLVRQLGQWGFELIDCQMSTSHLASLGARDIPRRDFMARIQRLVRQPPVAAPWRVEGDVK
ncbi:MAG: leucyl/phenylalanyl-tRNA--protein transferase [Vicinamibacterales bacterium]